MKSLFPTAIFRLLVLALLAGGGLLTTACNKVTEMPDYAATDATTIQKYLTDNAITNAQKQASGLYFIPVTTNATAPLATVGKAASIRYTGMLLNGTVVVASSLNGNRPSSFVVGSQTFLTGIEEGVSLMHLGDSAVFLVPSALAFGPSSSTKIPANSVLRFSVKLLDINPSITVLDEKLIQQYLVAKKITNAQRQTSGLYFVPTLVNTAGAAATAGKKVSVLYTGKFLDDKVFDASSLHNNATLDFTVGTTPKQVITGFDEGISLMRKGEKATFLIPSALAYGLNGNTGIEPNTTLIFDVEVVDVK
jgi:FKBP-type peptidyl-prolyl cis-trans isomerase